MCSPDRRSSCDPGLPWDAAGPTDAHADGQDESGDGLTFDASAMAGEEDADAGAAGRESPSGSPEPQLGEWIAAIVRRDERALAALYDATLSRVYGLVVRIVRRRSLAEEVVEDAYFQVWRQASRFDPARGTPLTWLLSMARSRAIDALRSESRFRHEPLDAEDPPGDVCDETIGCDDLVDLAHSRADLHRALALLGDQPRQLVALAFFRGLSHEEIAAQTRLPLGTVKSQIRRALISLRRVLAEGGAPTAA